jgi:hypothetical protein
MRIIKASEFAGYIYCQRAWWYQLKGMPPEDETEFPAGLEFHRQYGRQILLARWLEFLGWFLVLISLVLAAIALTMLSFQ